MGQAVSNTANILCCRGDAVDVENELVCELCGQQKQQKQPGRKNQDLHSANMSKKEEQKGADYGYPDYRGPTNDLETELKRVKKEYGISHKELYPRKYHYLRDGQYKNRQNSFLHMMQFNVLADGLSGVHTAEHLKDAASQKKTFVDVPIECLRFKYRGFRVLEEITRAEPDMICLQECDQFDFYMHYLRPQGFDGKFVAKSNSPCLKVAKTNQLKLEKDGVAIIWNTQRYKDLKFLEFGKSVESEKDNPEGIDIPALCILFKDVLNHKQFVVTAAHLKSTKDIDGEKIRLNQLQHLLPRVKQFAADNDDVPIFIGCDLNTPHTASYSVVYNSIMWPTRLPHIYSNDDKKEKPKLPEGYLSGYEGLDLYSAYYELEIPNSECKESTELPFTTFKKRKDGVVKHTIDYIFYQKNKAMVVALWELPKEEAINKTTLIPGWEYPSDHFAIQACFQF